MKKFLLCVIAAGWAGGGCIYDADQALPSYIHAIGVPAFNNETSIFQLDAALTQETRARFLVDGRVQVVDPDQNPQGELVCAVVQYAKEPEEVDAVTNRIFKTRLRIQVKMEFNDLTTQKTLWKEPAQENPTPFDATYEYFEPGNREGQPPETEDSARTKAVQEMARRIVQRTIDGW